MEIDESKGKSDWVPLTPAKSIPVPARYEFNFTDKWSRQESQETIEVMSRNHYGYNHILHCEFGPEFGPESTKPETPRRKNQGKRPKIKRHIPKVYDRTKPKKKLTPNPNKKPLTPNPIKQTKHPSTPKPQTPKRPRPIEQNILTGTSVEPSKDVEWEEVADSNQKICKRKLDFDSENRTMNQISEVLDSQPEVEMEVQNPVSRFNSLRVYTRNFRPNECLKNSRKIGPVFPSLFKKPRMRRPRATALEKFVRVISVTPTTQKQKRAETNEPMNLGQLASNRTTRSQTLSKAIRRPEFEKSTLNLNWATRRKRSKKPTRQNDLLSFVNDLFELQFSETFLWIASSIRTKLAARVEVQECFEHPELSQDNVVSWNDDIQHSIELSQNDVVIRNVRAQNVGAPSFVESSDDEEEDDEKDDVSASQDYDLYTKALVDFSSQMMEGLHIGDVLNQIVLRNQNDALVAAKEKSDSSKQHPKVDIDAESLRIFKLPIGSDENNGDDDTSKYMAKERKLYEGRLEEFISAMNLIQGDRQFSPWKGSVVDSVVGVFLTQNVGDHLSSHVFMNIVSRFPGVSESAIHDSELLRLVEGLSDEVDPEQLSMMEKDPTSCPSSQTSTQVNLEDGNVNSSQTEYKSGKIKGEKGKNEDKKDPRYWEELRLKYSTPKNRTYCNRDSVNWEAVRRATFETLSDAIKERGMKNLLTCRIKDFLQRLVNYHGSIDLEWLRDIPPQQAKEYLLNIGGLGLKSVECVRLLSLHQQAFPVDVNISRVTTRKGWVPLKPLPDDVPIHLLQSYPGLDDVQVYLWPRIMNLPHAKLYEAHCHLILFGKSICTPKKPNCGACPFRASCKHYASLCASARPRLEGPHGENMASQSWEHASSQGSVVETSPLMLPGPDGDLFAGTSSSRYYQPVIEMPESPVRECTDAFSQTLSRDIEDTDSEDELPMLNLCFAKREDDVSKALVTVNEVATHPTRPLKTKKRLRTEHHVYELPDSHPLLAGFETREPEEKCPYLLAIWMPKKEDSGQKSTEVVKYQDERIIQGTILIPCRTANRGSFPLNGTYFQDNEVFADHESSLHPIDVPREWVWNLKRRALYCATSVASICRDMSDDKLRDFFQNGSMCIRGFDRTTRGPKPLEKKFHERQGVSIDTR